MRMQLFNAAHFCSVDVLPTGSPSRTTFIFCARSQSCTRDRLAVLHQQHLCTCCTTPRYDVPWNYVRRTISRTYASVVFLCIYGISKIQPFLHPGGIYCKRGLTFSNRRRKGIVLALASHRIHCTLRHSTAMNRFNRIL